MTGEQQGKVKSPAIDLEEDIEIMSSTEVARVSVNVVQHYMNPVKGTPLIGDLLLLAIKLYHE